MHDQFKRLVNVFGLPNRPDPQAFLQEFAAAVGSTWPDGVLERAVSRLIAEHEDTFWPPPGKLKALCRAECPRQVVYSAVDDRAELTDEQMAEQERCVREYKRQQQEHHGAQAEWSKLPDVSREPFERMMQESPYQHLYRRQP